MDKVVLNLTKEYSFYELLEHAQPINHPTIDYNIILLLDVSAHPNPNYNTLICTTDAQIFVCSMYTDAIFAEIQHYYGYFYEVCKDILTLNTSLRKKLPYICNDILFLPIHNTTSKRTHWIAYHHIRAHSHTEFEQTILHFDDYSVILPISYHTYQQKSKEYDALLRESCQLYTNIRTFAERSTHPHNHPPFYFVDDMHYSLNQLFDFGVEACIKRLQTSNDDPLLYQASIELLQKSFQNIHSSNK